MAGYNGWKNYETWCVKLWLDNEEFDYREMVRLAKLAPGAYELSHTIRDYVERKLPDNTPASMFTDLLGSALDSVDWYEIAEAYFDDYNEEEGDDE